MRYIIYLRSSTELGINEQRKLCENYVKTKGSCESLEFSDIAPYKSVRMDEREGMIEAIEATQKGDIFLVDSRERLGKNNHLNAIALYKICEKGATVIFVSQSVVITLDEIPTIVKDLICASTEFTKYQAREIKKNNIQRFKDQGFRVGRIPYGYEKGEKALREVATRSGLKKRVYSSLKRNEYEQGVIACIKDLYRKGYSLCRIEAELKKRGIKNRSGVSFVSCSINSILQRELKRDVLAIRTIGTNFP